jgi:hypothetical protein
MPLTFNPAQTTNQLEGSGSGGAYQDMGVGNNEQSYREATRKGQFPGDGSGPDRSQGETPGAGSMYTVMLNERPNLSNPRNRGPERAPSLAGRTGMPIVEQGSRKTGRIGG